MCFIADAERSWVNFSKTNTIGICWPLGPSGRLAPIPRAPISSSTIRCRLKSTRVCSTRWKIPLFKASSGGREKVPYVKNQSGTENLFVIFYLYSFTEIVSNGQEREIQNFGRSDCRRTSSPRWWPNYSHIPSCGLLGFLDGHTAFNGALSLCRSSSSSRLCLGCLQRSGKEKGSRHSRCPRPRFATLYHQGNIPIMPLDSFWKMSPLNPLILCEGFHSGHRFLWFRNGSSNPYTRTSLLSVRLSSLANRPRRSVGQEHCAQAVGASTCNSLGSRIHGENASSQGSEWGRVHQQILRRSHASRISQTGRHFVVSILKFQKWDRSIRWQWNEFCAQVYTPSSV